MGIMDSADGFRWGDGNADGFAKRLCGERRMVLIGSQTNPWAQPAPALPMHEIRDGRARVSLPTARTARRRDGPCTSRAMAVQSAADVARWWRIGRDRRGFGQR